MYVHTHPHVHISALIRTHKTKIYNHLFCMKNDEVIFRISAQHMFGTNSKFCVREGSLCITASCVLLLTLNRVCARRFCFKVGNRQRTRIHRHAGVMASSNAFYARLYFACPFAVLLTVPPHTDHSNWLLDLWQNDHSTSTQEIYTLAFWKSVSQKQHGMFSGRHIFVAYIFSHEFGIHI